MIRFFFLFLLLPFISPSQVERYKITAIINHGTRIIETPSSSATNYFIEMDWENAYISIQEGLQFSHIQLQNKAFKTSRYKWKSLHSNDRHTKVQFKQIDYTNAVLMIESKTSKKQFNLFFWE